MAKNFTAPPLDKPVIDDNGYLSSEWRQWFADLFQTNDGLASQVGLVLPNVDGDSMAIANNAQGNILDQANIPDGLMFYNTKGTKLKPFVRVNGAWHSFNTTAEAIT